MPLAHGLSLGQAVVAVQYIAPARRLLFHFHGPGKPSARGLGELVFKAMHEPSITVPVWE